MAQACDFTYLHHGWEQSSDTNSLCRKHSGHAQSMSLPCLAPHSSLSLHVVPPVSLGSEEGATLGPGGQLSCELTKQALGWHLVPCLSWGHLKRSLEQLKPHLLTTKERAWRSEPSFPKLQKELSKFLARITLVPWCPWIDHPCSWLHEPKQLGVSLY